MAAHQNYLFVIQSYHPGIFEDESHCYIRCSPTVYAILYCALTTTKKTVKLTDKNNAVTYLYEEAHYKPGIFEKSEAGRVFKKLTTPTQFEILCSEEWETGLLGDVESLKDCEINVAAIEKGPFHIRYLQIP